MFDLSKMDKLFGLMRKDNIDAVVMGPSNTLEFMTGFNPVGCERFQALFIARDRRYFYICNLIYAEDMKRWFPDNAPFYVWNDGQGFHETLKKAVTEFGLVHKRMALGETIRAVDLMDMESLFSCEFLNGVALLEELRIIKTEEDLDKMRTAARLADGVMEDLVRFIRPGMTEKEIKVKIEDLFMAKGADGLSFSPIVACGANNSRPHYREDAGVIAQKDVLLLDFGCRYQGFCSDISRTFFIGGISEEEKEIYTLAREAQAAAVAAAREGVRCCDVDRAARDRIEKNGMGDYFLNRTGHGIGFDVHEAPYISGNNKRCLERGMAFSIEPGICIPGRVGMRVEDIVVINHQGETEVLNQFTRDIIIIK
ncbi:MAG: Xaa-Pro peptidase family protein [Desulfobacteraceae bacterium]|nr:Xaa-Pro peptidase family protein [Desulfobacteraceae bacterium]